MNKIKIKDFERVLNENNFIYVRCKGGHRIYKRTTDNAIFVLPGHKGKEVNGVIMCNFKRKYLT
jgi:predicted RNA binding protein YcfA (HicA-like mRNA interferase family)